MALKNFKLPSKVCLVCKKAISIGEELGKRPDQYNPPVERCRRSSKRKNTNSI